MAASRQGIAEIKQQVVAEVETHRQTIAELALIIHDNPELGFQENKASGWLVQHLEERGFSVEKGICELATAFRARYGKGTPVVAIIAEYDALPEIGHACGHNLIAAAAIGAGIAARKAVDALGGQVQVMGTPAEELGAGKVIIAERGGFGGVDIAMMIHPQTENAAITETAALQSINVEFFGKEAHAGTSPGDGINALEALIQSFNAVNSLRQRLKNQGYIHGIITDGGKLANIIPAHSAGTFVLRAENNAALEETKRMVLDCLAGAAQASGARLEFRWGKRMAAMRSNRALARLFAQNMGTLGRKTRLSPHRTTASTDLGTVSELVPTIQPLVAIAPPGAIRMHTPQATVVTGSEAGIQGALDGARAMAMTVVDVLATPAILSRIKREFAGQA